MGPGGQAVVRRLGGLNGYAGRPLPKHLTSYKYWGYKSSMGIH
jgi:hypothetical protein